MAGISAPISETWRGARASVAWLLGAPLVNARIVLGSADKAAARALISGHFLRFLATCRVEVRLDGTPPDPGYGAVLCYNETSFIDVAAFGAVMWPHIDRAAAADLYAWLPFGRSAARKAGIAMVARGDRQATDRLLDQMAERVRRGERLAWGGEGRLVGRDGIGRFKIGAALIAIRAQAPIIPVVFHGGHRAMRLGSVRARPGRVRVRFGAPIPVDGYTEDQARLLADHVQSVVAATYADLAKNGTGPTVQAVP